jgi:hypothetical protein
MINETPPPYEPVEPTVSIQGYQVVEKPPPPVSTPLPPVAGPESPAKTFLRRGVGRQTFGSQNFTAVFSEALLLPVLAHGLDEVSIAPLLAQNKAHPELKLFQSAQIQLWNVATHIMTLLEMTNRLPAVKPGDGTSQQMVEWDRSLFLSLEHGHRLLTELPGLSAEQKLASYEVLRNIRRRRSEVRL